jgi:hypothetical protein
LKLVGVSVPAAFAFRTASAATNGKKTMRIVEFDASGIRTGVVEVEKVEESVADWKKQLTADQFQIARQADTEYPGTDKYCEQLREQRREQRRRRIGQLHLM